MSGFVAGLLYLAPLARRNWRCCWRDDRRCVGGSVAASRAGSNKPLRRRKQLKPNRKPLFVLLR